MRIEYHSPDFAGSRSCVNRQWEIEDSQQWIINYINKNCLTIRNEVFFAVFPSVFRISEGQMHECNQNCNAIPASSFWTRGNNSSLQVQTSATTLHKRWFLPWTCIKFVVFTVNVADHDVEGKPKQHCVHEAWYSNTVVGCFLYRKTNTNY